MSGKLGKVSTPEKERSLYGGVDHRGQVSMPENGPMSTENIHASNSIESSTNPASMSQDRYNETDDPDRLGGTTKARGAGRKQHHWKSQSVGDQTMGGGVRGDEMTGSNQSNGCPQSTVSSSGQTLEEETQETTTFSANRELWQRRATSQTQLNPPIATSNAACPKTSYRTSQEFREMRQKQTPDLVMDLPLAAQDASKKSASSSSLSSSDDETTVIGNSGGGIVLVQPSRTEAATSPTGPGPESPDMSTAAERFAKQNQCTLKKNTKTNPEGSKLKRLETTTGTDLDSTEVETTEEIVRSASTNQISDSLALRSPLPPRSTPKIAAKFADMHLTGGSQVSSMKPQVKVKPTILRKPVLPFPHPHMSPELARKIEKQAQSAEQAN